MTCKNNAQDLLVKKTENLYLIVPLTEIFNPHIFGGMMKPNLHIQQVIKCEEL